MRPPINVYRPTCVHAYIYVSRWARNLNFGRSLHLHTYMMNASCEGSGQSAHSECRGKCDVTKSQLLAHINLKVYNCMGGSSGDVGCPDPRPWKNHMWISYTGTDPLENLLGPLGPTPSRNNWNPWVLLLLERGLLRSIFKNVMSTHYC